jgi:hypothetical protein
MDAREASSLCVLLRNGSLKAFVFGGGQIYCSPPSGCSIFHCAFQNRPPEGRPQVVFVGLDLDKMHNLEA